MHDHPFRSSGGSYANKAYSEAIDTIMRKTGTIAETAAEVCTAWRLVSTAPAVRLWILNEAFEELNLLALACDDVLKTLLALTSNRLSTQSVAMRAVRRRNVVRKHDPRNSPDWHHDAGAHQLLLALPYLICVPFVSADSLPDDPQTPRLIGALDIHLPASAELPISDAALAFLARISAAALLRARSHERFVVLDRLDQAAIDLVSPADGASIPLGVMKASYLSKVERVIRDALKVHSVSVFEADDSRDVLRCISTTGIERHPEPSQTLLLRPAPPSLTWQVFETATSVNRIAATDRESDDAFRETRHIPVDAEREPLLVVPLPGKDARSATGVIRVAERECNHHRADRLQAFSKHDQEVLEQVAAHVSPILRMVRMQAHRELFITRTAHQVTQPLQGVIAYVSNILDGVYSNDPHKRDMKLRYVRQMANAAAGMMRSSVWLSGALVFGDLRQQLELKQRRPAEYFIERIIDLQPIRDHDAIRVALTDKAKVDNLGTIIVDDIFFDQVVQNLLHNAVKYSYPGTLVQVAVNRDRDDLVVLISSVGVPITETERERIFWDRERGAVASRYDPIGTGQGLYLARQIMRGIGGDVTLDSRLPVSGPAPPRGFPPPERTTFQIHYPGAFAHAAT